MCCLQPWTLDSSISEENRAVIEKMLLEEEYPFSDLLLNYKGTGQIGSLAV